jgi:hypothetical protein
MSPGGRGDLMHMTARAAHKSLPILLKLEDAYNAFFSVAPVNVAPVNVAPV